MSGGSVTLALKSTLASGAELSRNEYLNADEVRGMGSRARSMGIGDFIDDGPKVHTVHSAW